MKKNIYVSPKMEMMDIEMKCDILDVSTNLEENKPGYGGEVGGGDAPAPEAGNRDDWGDLW